MSAREEHAANVLVSRLRDNAERWTTGEQIEDPHHFGDVFADLTVQAADEIDRLRDAIAEVSASTDDEWAREKLHAALEAKP